VPHITLTKFTEIKFESSEEELLARTFTELNKFYFSALRSLYVQQRLAIVLDPTKAHEFIAADAAFKAKIELLDELIGD